VAGASGSIPLIERAPVSFHDLDGDGDGGDGNGDGDWSDLVGTIVAVVPEDPFAIGRELSASTPPVEDLDVEGIPEEERQRILAGLQASAPHIDHDRLAAGTLAGRATADRPDVPPWAYERYVDDHPAVSLDDLLRVRFPVVFGERRGSTVSSVAEDLEDHGRPEGPLFTLAEALDRWRFLHDAGVVRWDRATRAVEHTGHLGEMFVAERAWAMRVRARRGLSGPGRGGSGRHPRDVIRGDPRRADRHVLRGDAAGPSDRTRHSSSSKRITRCAGAW